RRGPGGPRPHPRRAATRRGDLERPAAGPAERVHELEAGGGREEPALRVLPAARARGGCGARARDEGALAVFSGRRVLAVLNPTSGARRGGDLAEELREGVLGHGAADVEVRVTEGPDD